MKSTSHLIEDVKAREIFDSRGNPTVEVEVHVEGGRGKAAVPSGASTGIYEALELRDKNGIGVSKALANVNKVIREKVIGRRFDQKGLDSFLIKLDGTKSKKKLGANAILGVSLAFSHACADAQGIPLYRHFSNVSGLKMSIPIPMFNILNGGRHSTNGLDIQEFMIVPLGAESFKEALKRGEKTFKSLGEIIKKRDLGKKMGDEGGYSPNLDSNEEAIRMVLEAISKAGYIAGKDASISLDAASSEFYKNGKYVLKNDGSSLNAEELISLYSSWSEKYPIISIEDPLYQDDWKNWSKSTKELGRKVKIVGDDLFVTNRKRLEKGISRRAGNAIIIKLNQIGSVSEAIEVVQMAKKAGYTCIVSHRSGETMDTSIADFAVGVGAECLKSGAPLKKERAVKYQRMVEIEKELGKEVKYRRRMQ